jgi:hypothetical protein
MVEGGFIENMRFFMRGVFSLVMAVMVSACVYAATPKQLGNWQDNPKACAEFWDTYFPKALNGDHEAASILLKSIRGNGLVPPDQTYTDPQNTYLRLLTRLAIRPYERLIGNTFDTHWMRQGKLYLVGETGDIVRGYLPTLSSAPNAFIPVIKQSGKCSDKSGLSDPTQDVWAAACRQILADDGVLPSSEAFLETIPEGAKACGYKGE